MATRGAQPGNTNSTKSKRWAEAIDKAIKQYTDKKRKIEAGQALDRLAHNLVKLALEGDLWANQEIGNRLDGKPHQSVDVDANLNAFIGYAPCPIPVEARDSDTVESSTGPATGSDPEGHG
jgi:hypothetical protein